MAIGFEDLRATPYPGQDVNFNVADCLCIVTTVSASLSGRSCQKYRKATRFEIFSDVINGPNRTRLWN